MSSKLRYLALAVLVSPFAGSWETLFAQEPGWTSRVLKLGGEREVSEQTPILERPYRPLHFYGNAVRRSYYRGNPWPMPKDILITTAFLAPSSRERELQLEQRLSGPLVLSPTSPDDQEKQEPMPAVDAEQLQVERDAEPEANTPKDSAISPIDSQASAGISRNNGSSRRGQRGRN